MPPSMLVLSYWACSLVGAGAGAGLGWLMLVFLRGKQCWLVGLDWLKPTSEQANYWLEISLYCLGWTSGTVTVA